MSEQIIHLERLTKSYGTFTAVDNLNLTIRSGEVFGLLGPNGAGKSTTILMMLGLTDPTSGKAEVCGLDATREAIKVKRLVGYLADDVGFYEDMTACENLVFTAQLNGMSRDLGKARALYWLRQVGLSEVADKKVAAFSRGMRQRLGLADVLIKDPKIIILDEPTLGLDPTGVQELLKLIRSLSKERGITVLLSSHQLHQIQQVCDRVGLFVKGKLIAVGNAEELAHQLFQDASTTISIEASDSNEHWPSALRSLPGVTDVRQNPTRPARWEIITTQDISLELAQLMVTHQVTLQHFSRKDYGLDDIYQRYFQEEGNAV